MLNRIIIMGRLGKDPELRHTQQGTPVASFSLAVDRDFKDKGTGERVTDWIDVVAWRQTGEFVSRYFRKGQRIEVSGVITTRTYEKDGQNRKSTELRADQVFFGDSKKSDDPEPAEPYAGQLGGFQEMEDGGDGDGLPF